MKFLKTIRIRRFFCDFLEDRLSSVKFFSVTCIEVSKIPIMPNTEPRTPLNSCNKVDLRSLMVVNPDLLFSR
jgi:hypothetical protein